MLNDAIVWISLLIDLHLTRCLVHENEDIHVRHHITVKYHLSGQDINDTKTDVQHRRHRIIIVSQHQSNGVTMKIIIIIIPIIIIIIVNVVVVVISVIHLQSAKQQPLLQLGHLVHIHINRKEKIIISMIIMIIERSIRIKIDQEAQARNHG